MTKAEVIEKLNNIANGTFFKVKYFTELPVNAKAKKSGIVAIKEVECVCRKGVEYTNQKLIKRLVEELGKVLTHELPHGQWSNDSADIIEFTDKNGNYRPKARVYMSTCIADRDNNPINKPKVVYKVDGAVVTYNELKDMGVLQPSFFKDKEDTTPQKLNRLAELEKLHNAGSVTADELEELLKLSQWAYGKTKEINCEHILAIG